MIIFFIDLLLFIPFPLNAFSAFNFKLSIPSYAFNFKLSIAVFAFSLRLSLTDLPTKASLAILNTLPKASFPTALPASFSYGTALRVT